MDVRNKVYTRNGKDVMHKGNVYLTDAVVSTLYKVDNIVLYSGRIMRATEDFTSHATDIGVDITDGKFEIISPIPPYFDFFVEADWVEISGGYKLEVGALIHKQSGIFLDCLVFNSDGEKMLTPVLVSQQGLVTIEAGIPFDGRMCITGRV